MLVDVGLKRPDTSVVIEVRTTGRNFVNLT
jgi:hypothetical protein